MSCRVRWQWALLFWYINFFVSQRLNLPVGIRLGMQDYRFCPSWQFWVGVLYMLFNDFKMRMIRNA